MIGKIVKGVARALIAQPWDYIGEGAPHEPEFRISPDEGYLAVFLPAVGRWRILRADDLSLAAEADPDEMEDNTGDWTQYLAVLDPDA